MGGSEPGLLESYQASPSAPSSSLLPIVNGRPSIYLRQFRGPLIIPQQQYPLPLPQTEPFNNDIQGRREKKKKNVQPRGGEPFHIPRAFDFFRADNTKDARDGYKCKRAFENRLAFNDCSRAENCFFLFVYV